MEITVKFSSLIRMLARREQDHVDVEEGTTIDQLTEILDRKYDNLSFDSQKTKFMINNRFVTGRQILSDGDEVSVFQTLKG